MTSEREAMTLEQESFEQWARGIRLNVRKNKHGDYSYTDTVLARAGWKAALTNLSRAADPVGRVHIQLHHDCPSMRNVEFLEDIELPPGTHLLYTNPPKPARDAKEMVRNALLLLADQFEGMGEAAYDDGEYDRRDVWENAASQAKFRAKDDSWIDAAMAQESGE